MSTHRPPLILLFVTTLVCARGITGAAAEAPAADALPAVNRAPAAIVELQIPSAGALMPAHIYLAAGPGPHPTLVFLHGIPGNERNLDIAQALRVEGFNTLFFHYRGAWGAQGRYSLLGQVQDVEAVLRFLRGEDAARRLRVRPDALTLVGHSLGGFTALAAGAADLRCVVAMAPVNLAVWRRAVENPGDPSGEELLRYADSLFMLRGMSATALRQELMGAPLAALDTRGFAARLVGRAVLMLAGHDDTVTAPAVHFQPVVASWQGQAGLDLTAELLPGDHSFSASRQMLIARVAAWAGERCR